MNNNFQIPKLYKKRLNFFFILFIFFSTGLTHSQTKSNLEVFYSLIDSAVASASKQIPADKKDIKLNLSLGNLYSIFENRIISDLSKEGKKIIPADSSKSIALTLNFTCENADVNYGKMYRDGLFGAFHVRRTVSISGNYIFPYLKAKLQNYDFSISDTVKVSEIKTIENNSYPFTKGPIPSQPFLPSLVEPVIAIGAAAIAVILFFTVRSK